MRGPDPVERERRAEAVRLLDGRVGGRTVRGVVQQHLAVLEPAALALAAAAGEAIGASGQPSVVVVLIVCWSPAARCTHVMSTGGSPETTAHTTTVRMPSSSVRLNSNGSILGLAARRVDDCSRDG